MRHMSAWKTDVSLFLEQSLKDISYMMTQTVSRVLFRTWHIHKNLSRKNLMMMMNGILAKLPVFVWCWWLHVVKMTSSTLYCHLSKIIYIIKIGSIGMPLWWLLVRDSKGCTQITSLCIMLASPGSEHSQNPWNSAPPTQIVCLF